MNQRVIGMLKFYERQLEEILALLEYLHREGQLRCIDGSNLRALEDVREAIGAEIFEHTL